MNRVYIHEGDTWTLASVYASRHPLPVKSTEYAVIETRRPPSVEEVCVLTEDGRRLCDFGPAHDHDPVATYRAPRPRID